ncbi:hypothetical protein HQ403_01200 [Candidatus Kaiserbacteria bacterium]|nr:hypothetical protein [Candidatus Kaiserbacteria bacterium]
MKITAFYTKFFLALAILLLALFMVFVLGFLFTPTLSDNPQSVELGVASRSPIGISGGIVVPASCGSPHTGDLCTAPSFSATSASGEGTSVSINAGDSATLTWVCYDSTSGSGTNFSTGGATSGSAVVSPTVDTTYTIICSNGGQGTVNLTVVNPSLSITASPSLIQTGHFTLVNWSATDVNTCTVDENNPMISDSWSGTSGTQTTSTLGQQTTYTLSCVADGGTTTSSVTINLVPIFQEF